MAPATSAARSARHRTRADPREGPRGAAAVLRGRRRPLPHPRPPRPRAARQPRARGAPRRRRVLRVEHPRQPHERVRRHLRLLRLRGEEGRAARLHDGARRGGEERRVAAEARARGPRRRRAAPRPAVLLLHRHAEGDQAGAAGHPRQGLHRGRGLLLPPPLPQERRGGARRAEGGRARLDARRRGRDLREGDARPDHQGQGRRRAVARRHADRPPAGHPDERDDALRPRRVGRGPGRPPAAPARAAGRDRRLRDLHPARLPALGGAGHEAARRRRASTT